MKNVIVTPPVYYPLVLDQAKDHLRVDHSNDDKNIQSLISVATNRVEQFTRRRLITQTWYTYLDEWPDEDYLTLPFGQLQSVTSVKYTDSSNTEILTFTDASLSTTDDFDVDINSDPGRVILVYGDSWPSVVLWPMNPIKIEFVCGYGANAVQAITAASNASPIVITIAGHGYLTGDEVYIYSVTGNTAANGTWIITKASDNTFSLNGSDGNAAWVSGGSCVKQSVPPNIIHAIKLHLTDLYENRESFFAGQGFTVTKFGTIESLLFPYRIPITREALQGLYK